MAETRVKRNNNIPSLKAKEMERMTGEISESQQWDIVYIPYSLPQAQFIEMVWKEFEEKRVFLSLSFRFWEETAWYTSNEPTGFMKFVAGIKRESWYLAALSSCIEKDPEIPSCPRGKINLIANLARELVRGIKVAFHFKRFYKK